MTLGLPECGFLRNELKRMWVASLVRRGRAIEQGDEMKSKDLSYLAIAALAGLALTGTVRVAHGPTMPPEPWETIQIAHGPTMPPEPWETAA